MRNYLKLCVVVGVLLLTGCQSRQPANVRHVSLQIFEVIDCKTSVGTPMSLKGDAGKYCLAAKPVIDETDVRGAQASRGESGAPQLNLYFTLKAGQRMREVTERLSAQRLKGNDQGRMAIVADGTLIAAPAVNGVISDSLVINGAFTWDGVVQLAESLNAPRPQ